jgi:hypothetical protein
MRLGAPFIAPRQLGAIESIPGRQILPSVAWRTGQSGAPPDSPVHHRTLSGANFLPYLAKPTVGSLGAVGAPDTVRCPLPTVGSATCPAQIAQPTVGSPDSPVNFSRTPLNSSRERQVRLSQPGAPDTVRCTQTEQTLAELSYFFSNSIFPVSST